VSAPKGVCVECGELIASNATAVHEVRAYERDRRQGGMNHALGRTRVDGRIWHEPCFDSWLRQRSGRGEQASLL
jgi:hypothetical protein